MGSSRFRAFYIGALVVAGIGLIGSSFVPRAQANSPLKTAQLSVASTPAVASVDHKQADAALTPDLSVQTSARQAQGETAHGATHEPAGQSKSAQAATATELPRPGPLKPLIGLLGLSSLSFAGLLALATRGA